LNNHIKTTNFLNSI